MGKQSQLSKHPQKPKVVPSKDLLCMVYSSMHIHMYVYNIGIIIPYVFTCISLGALVPNSRDRHEKQWRPDFTRHKTHPKIRFV